MATQEQIAEALKPCFSQQVLVREVYEPDMQEGESGPCHGYSIIATSLSVARANITRACSYIDKTSSHWAIYRWDAELEEWELLEYIPKGMHKDDFPWRQ